MRIGEPVVWLPTTTSTMDDVTRLAAEGAAEGLVVVADEQTAGRGRGGRSWIAPPGSSLLLSVLLRPPLPAARLSTLPLVTGVAVAEAIEDVAGASCRLKWPNDVLLGDRKIAGILVTTQPGPDNRTTAIVGIGINVSTPLDALPHGAASLLTETGSVLDRKALLDALLTRLDCHYSAFLEASGRPDLAPWTTRAAYLGEMVEIRDDERRYTGWFRGVDADGALVLEIGDNTVRRIVAGDLVRGPRPTPNDHQ